MTLKEAIEYFGNGNSLCNVLNIERQNITNWRKKGSIPMYQQYRLERITKGELKADKENDPIL